MGRRSAPRRPDAGDRDEELAATEPLAAGPAGAAAPAWRPGQVILDDYVVERALGRGGMGTVYLARSRSTRKPLAVKRIRPEFLGDPGRRRSFLRELLHWSELPPHRHLAAFRFFRSLAGEVLVFAEYVEGGSLGDWIRDGRLDGPAIRLDIAIQAAWGLQAAHDCGLVHQDVKPGNILLTADGLAKITDFGLARTGGEPTETGPPGLHGRGSSSTTVPCSGLTPAYCSPEQAERAPVSRATDVWSWALCVLEMFAGEVSWLSGVAGSEALESYLAGSSASEDGEPIPPPVAEVLRRALSPLPEQRWSSLAEAAEALAGVYRRIVGRPYSRSPAPRPESIAPDRPPPVRVSALGVPWEDPGSWLARIRQAAGIAAPPDSGPLLDHPRSLRALAISDVAAAEEGCTILEHMVAGGRRELVPELARLCGLEARLHQVVDDFPGAVTLAGRSVELLERVVALEGRADLRPELAAAMSTLASNLWWATQFRQAAALHERIAAIHGELVEEGRTEFLLPQLKTFVIRGFNLSCAGDDQEAIAAFDRALGACEAFPRSGRRLPRAVELEMAAALHYKGRALLIARDLPAAQTMLERAAAIFVRCQRQAWAAVRANELACVYLNLSQALAGSGQIVQAATLARRAVRLRLRLARTAGWSQMAFQLAEAYSCQAAISLDGGDAAGSARQVRRAIRIYRRAVHLEGRRDVRPFLAESLMQLSSALAREQRPDARRRALREAIAILEPESAREDGGRGRELLESARAELAGLERPDPIRAGPA